MVFTKFNPLVELDVRLGDKLCNIVTGFYRIRTCTVCFVLSFLCAIDES